MYKYVSVAKSELKKMFLAALKHMGKKNLIAYKIGYKFFYEISDKSMGYVSTDQLNDTIINNENSICNSLNQKYKFSDKLHDRQNLLLIYGNQSYHREFEDEKIKRLMKDDISIKKLNKEIEVSYGKYSCKIDDQHPIISYFQSVMIMMSKIDDDDFNDTDNIILLKSEIRGLIKEKVRKTIRQYHYTDKVHNEIVYPFVSDSCERDMNIVEDLLFSSNSICNINNDQNQEEKEKVMNHKVIDGFHYIEDCWTEEELRHLPFLQPLSTQSFSHAI